MGSETSVDVDLRDPEEWARVSRSQSGSSTGTEAFRAKRQAWWTHFQEKASVRFQTC